MGAGLAGKGEFCHPAEFLFYFSQFRFIPRYPPSLATPKSKREGFHTGHTQCIFICTNIQWQRREMKDHCQTKSFKNYLSFWFSIRCNSRKRFLQLVRFEQHGVCWEGTQGFLLGDVNGCWAIRTFVYFARMCLRGTQALHSNLASQGARAQPRAFYQTVLELYSNIFMYPSILSSCVS